MWSIVVTVMAKNPRDVFKVALPKTLADKVRKMAAKEQRTINNMLHVLIVRAVEQ